MLAIYLICRPYTMPFIFIFYLLLHFVRASQPMEYHGSRHMARFLESRKVNVTQAGVSSINFAGVSIFPNGSLSNLNLTTNCENLLYQKINCDDSVSKLWTRGYVGSFDNSTQTTLLCDTGCEASISELRNAVSTSCGNTVGLLPGLPFIGLVDMLWSNWNQSCFTDPTTKENCNSEKFPSRKIVPRFN